jgi:hypothetical protein
MKDLKEFYNLVLFLMSNIKNNNAFTIVAEVLIKEGLYGKNKIGRDKQRKLIVNLRLTTV